MIYKYNITRRVKNRLLLLFRDRNNDRKISFIIAGAQKSGTSALAHYMKSHEEICMSRIKELHYFSSDKYFRKTPDYSLYHHYFDCHNKHKAMGEATPIYMYWKSAPKRIWEYNPDLKIIIILRNPIERAYSHWNMQREKKLDSLSFLDAITTEKDRVKESFPNQHREYSYIDRGIYTEQLKRIWKYFPIGQTLILKSEDLKANSSNTMKKVCDFLEVARFKVIKEEKIHSREYVREMASDEKSFLKSTFKHEIKELESMLNWDCSDWLK